MQAQDFGLLYLALVFALISFVLFFFLQTKRAKLTSPHPSMQVHLLDLHHPT
jgi:hypothetical protein